MRSRVMPGSSPTMERRLWVSRLNSVDLPTLGRPTIATSGMAFAAAMVVDPDLRYFAKTCLQSILPSHEGRCSAGILVRSLVPDPIHTVQVKNLITAHNRDS